MDNLFVDTFEYKVIYVFSIPDNAHQGLLKIGDASLKTNKSLNELLPNSKALNDAAKARIKEYTNTAGIVYDLLHTEIAIRHSTDKSGKQTIKAFRDYNVHRVLMNSGYKKIRIKGTTGKEWFKVDLSTAVAAIDAVKKNYNNLSNTPIKNIIPIVFRPEQKEAIERTIKQFKKGDRMLWNAKMRFGKTLSALEVVKRMDIEKTIIITHRPVVDDGWYEDFGKIFQERTDYIYGSKNKGYTVEQLIASKKKFVYFASMQDLRGSAAVGKKFEKNNAVFDLNWDLVIVDEAHEGTTTALGNEVITRIVKADNEKPTKFLALSGTPFNILGEYDDNIYTWDYIMEQQSKADWDKYNFGDSNPYDELPELRIYTYDLGKLVESPQYIELEDKAFNFREFFRTWTGEEKIDHQVMPSSAKVGDFVHEKDIWSFLNLITKANSKTNYPYSTDEYRDLFRHSLWMIPGVKEGAALSELLHKHPIFGNGAFKIVNVAGNGDKDEEADDALSKVRSAINAAGEDEYTITLSCGKLTTGVTVPEWTAVFMLAGSYSTSASNYLQTIFRVQSPCNKNGKIKSSCYVFDFAPDRTLKMVAESVAVSTKAGRTGENDRRIMGAFLNYCPVISVDGTVMKKYDANNLLQQLKRAYAERAVQNGFDDTNLYNDELLKLDELDIQKFNNLKGIVGTSKASPKSHEIDVNSQGFTDEEYEKYEQTRKKPAKELTPEEKEFLEKLKEKKKQRNNAISILRSISIRMPLLIYGADVDVNEDVTIDMLTDIVDDASWEEFMPNKVTKTLFKDFVKYYDPEVFIAAGRKIRNIAKSADDLLPTERSYKIAELFKCFKNPDKETVLTPWRVVNLHMSECLGGYDFYDETHHALIESHAPRFVDLGEVTKSTLNNPSAKILEINSKSGLYPLYVAYSLYRARLGTTEEKDLSLSEAQKYWDDVINDNVFVICKTPMAKSITRRTLVGFRKTNVNAHYFDDLINYIENKSKKFTERISKGSYWKKGNTEMKFNAVVGNPPYQIMDGGNSNSSKAIYNYFVLQAKELDTDYISMITPSRWFVGGKGLDDYRKKMLSDNRISSITDYADYRDVFPNVELAGGVSYFLWDSHYAGDCEIINVSKNDRNISKRPLSEFEILIRDNKAVPIVEKVIEKITKKVFLSDRVSVRKPFNLPTDYSPKKSGTPCWFKQKHGKCFANPNDVEDHNNYLNKWKLLVPRAPIAGQTDFTKPVGFYYDGNTIIAKPGECCTEAYLVCGAFETKDEVMSYKSYIFTKIVRFLLLQSVISQDVTRENYRFVPDLGTYTGQYTDEILCKMWGITDVEWEYINSRIHNYESQKKA